MIDTNLRNHACYHNSIITIIISHTQHLIPYIFFLISNLRGYHYSNNHLDQHFDMYNKVKCLKKTLLLI